MKISYEVERDGTVEQRVLPFVIGVIGDFSGAPAEPLPRLRDRRFVEVTVDNLWRVRQSIDARARVMVDGEASHLQCRYGFDPACVCESVDSLREGFVFRRQMVDLLGRIGVDRQLDAVVLKCLSEEGFRELLRAHPDPEQPPAAVVELLSQCGWSGDPWAVWANEALIEPIGALVRYAAQHELPQSRDAGTVIRTIIAESDRELGLVLDKVLHDPAFQELEAAWRGLEYLVNSCYGVDGVTIKFLNVTKRELLRDLQRAPEFDQSALFRMVYGEFSVLGGEPFGLLVGVYQFGASAEDIELLERISQVAGSAHCPFVAAAAPSMFHVESLRDLDTARPLQGLFQSTVYARWKGFRRQEDSRYVGLVLPRFLLRAPYAESEELPGYFEMTLGGAGRLWGSGAFLLAAALGKAFTGGFSRGFGGSENGGLAANLPLAGTDGPTEVAFTDERQRELAGLGFIALCHRKGSADAVFFDAPSCCAPLLDSDAERNVQMQLSVQLENVLVASRFAHYLKCILRDKFGSFGRLPEWEQYLDSWIRKYASPSAEITPLRSAGVRVEKRAGGGARIIANLSPHFRNRARAAALRVVVTLPQMNGVEW